MKRAYYLWHSRNYRYRLKVIAPGKLGTVVAGWPADTSWHTAEQCCVLDRGIGSRGCSRDRVVTAFPGASGL